MTLAEILKEADLDLDLFQSVKFEARYANWKWNVYAIVTDIEDNDTEVYISQL